MSTRTRMREHRPRKSPSQARSRATVDAILTAAARVFVSLGYAGATTNHIAARAGVSVGSLYEYFPNKDAMLVALLERHVGEAEAILERTAAAVAESRLDLRGAVSCFVDAMVALHARDPALHRLLFEEAPLPARVRRRIGGLEDRVVAFVEAFLAGQPRFRRPDAALAARVAVQTIEALTHTLVLREKDADIAARAAEITTMVVGYLSAPALTAAEPSRTAGLGRTR